MSGALNLAGGLSGADQLANATASTGNLQGIKKASDKQAQKAAEDFEAMFLSQMLAPMWAGVDTNGPFGGGSAEETYRSMLINEYGKSMSQAGGVGLAASIKAELLKLQEKPTT